jgi:ribonuclease BN (tRNA processing enzyme)
MPDVTFTILGSSAGMPQPGRGNSGYVLDVGGRLFQFDCGGGVSLAFRAAGFDPLSVERIIISHTHPDHICDLPLYIQMQYLAGRREPLIIHVPEEALEPTQAMCRMMYIIEQKLPFDLSFMIVREDDPIRADGVTIQPIANSHMKKYEPFVAKYGLANKQQCYSFRITVARKTILYSADLGSEKDLLDHLKGFDLLVIESTHINLEAVLAKAAEVKVSRIVLTHIAEDYDTDAALAIAQKMGLTDVQIAKDGMRIVL